MDLDTSIRSTSSADERPRTAQSMRRELLDGSRHNYDMSSSYSSDQGPGPATIETTPPPRTILSARSRTRFVPHVVSRNIQESEKPDCLTADQTVDLFTRKIQEARNETHHVFSGSDEVSDALKPKLTIDLGRARIERLPDAIVDLIITDVERLSLSHNMLRYMPSRIADCNQLRYLNIRSNDFREIPPSVFRMPFLEILDVSKNRVSIIPPEIKKLESLRVFSIVHNRLDDLPLELTGLPRLKVLKVAENPFRRNIKNVIREKEQEVAFSEMLENERDAALTSEILKYLKKQKSVSVVTPVLENGEMNDPQSASESARPAKRALSGRFPVIPNPNANLSDPASEDGTSPANRPSLPTKSHLRGASGSISAALQKRPGIAPVVSGNERNRSNSESVIQASAAARQKRMGIMRKDRTELDSIDETKAVRQSHMRGFSYGSALKKNGSISSPGAVSSSPSSPKESRKDRAQFIRRLSSLPEHKNDHARRPLIEGARGILYALYQVHPHISGLISASRGQDPRKSTLEMSFFNASVHVDKLNKSLEYTEQIDPESEDSWEKMEQIINNDCATCIKSFVHVTAQLQENTHKIVAGADPRYVRSFMLLLYGSIVEVKNAIKSFGLEAKHHHRQMSSGATHPIATIPEEPTVEIQEQQPPSNQEQAMDGMTLKQPARFRSDTVLKAISPSKSDLQPVQPPSLHIPNNIHLTNSTVQGTYNRASSALSTSSTRSFAARSRSNSRTTNMIVHHDGSSVASTPRSTENYQHPPTVSMNGHLNPNTGLTEEQEEQRFEPIFLNLSKAYEAALHAVPVTMLHISRCLNAANDQRQAKDVLDIWNALLQKCKTCLDLTQALQMRLTHMRVKDSGVGISTVEGGRHDPSFWVLAKSFLSSFVGLVTEMKDVRKSRLLVLPPDSVQVLRPVQKACQEAASAISSSPWNYMLHGVTPMPAPTPFGPRGSAVEPMARPQFNRSATVANSNVSSYAQAIAQQQSGQAQYVHYPPSSRMHMQLHPSSSLSATSTPGLAAPGSAGGASPLSATSTTSMPATPLSAALGPAAQATVPNTPASLYGDSFFKGDVFQRADSLLSMPQAAGVNFLTNSRRG